MKKGFIIGFATASVLATGIAFASEMLSEVYKSEFPIKINGKAYTAEMPVLNYQGRTYLALREFGTATGNNIDFQNNTIIINTKDYTPSVSTPSSTSTQSSTSPTLGQKNALSKAKQYLNISGFSRKGLIEQLEFEGFSHEEALYGVDNSNTNWNEQAAKKAKQYLNIMSFSKSRLIEQLEFEGFTSEEAKYGATSVGY